MVFALIKKSQFLTYKCYHDFKQVIDVELVHLISTRTK